MYVCMCLVLLGFPWVDDVLRFTGLAASCLLRVKKVLA